MDSRCVCDCCGCSFKPELFTQKLRRGIEYMYLECPNCKAKFTAFFSSNRIKKLQGRQRAISESKPFDNAKYDRNKIKIKKLMDRLKKKYEVIANRQ